MLQSDWIHFVSLNKYFAVSFQLLAASSSVTKMGVDWGAS